MDLDPEEMLMPEEYDIEYRTEANEAVIDAYILQLKSMFFRQICKARHFEIFLITPSKVNELLKKEENEKILE